MSNIIDLIIIMTLIYLPMAAVIVGVVSFILFLILKYNNNRKYIIFLIKKCNLPAHNNKCYTIFYNRWINRLWTDRLGDWFLDICSLKSVVYCLKELNKYHVNWEIQVL